MAHRLPGKGALLGMGLLATLCGQAQATESGGSIYPMGSENYLTAALPPPGLYGMVFLSHYQADELRDNDGNRVPIDFSVRANAIAPRIVWITPQKVFGGDLGFHAIVPLVDLDVKVGPLGEQKKSGLGDVIFGGVIGHHHSPKLHSIVGLDFYAPTGRYDKNDLANIGRNYWAAQPLAGVSLYRPDGHQRRYQGDVHLQFREPRHFVQVRPGISLRLFPGLGRWPWLGAGRGRLCLPAGDRRQAQWSIRPKQ